MKHIQDFNNFMNESDKKSIMKYIFFLENIIDEENTTLSDSDQDMLKKIGTYVNSREIIAMGSFDTLDETDIPFLSDALEKLQDEANQ